jgi:hypothetical protein
MPSSRRLRRVALVETYVTEERIASIIRVTRIGELGTLTVVLYLWPLVRKRTIPTERPPLVDEIECQLLWIEGCRMVSAADPLRSLISVF